MGNKLTVAWVVHRFDPNHFIHQRMIVRMNMLDQLKLGVALDPTIRISVAPLRASAIS